MARDALVEQTQVVTHEPGPDGGILAVGEGYGWGGSDRSRHLLNRDRPSHGPVTPDGPAFLLEAGIPRPSLNPTHQMVWNLVPLRRAVPLCNPLV